MDDRNDWDGWIQAYMDGELNPEETQIFQKQLADSAPFSLRYREYQESLLQLESVQLDRLRSDMKDWVANSPATSNTPIRPMIWLASAAMIVLVVLVGSWLYWSNQYSAESLLSSAMDYNVDEKGRESGALQGLSALENREFEIAITKLPSWVDLDGQTTLKAYLYLAKAHIGLNQWDSASYYLDLLDQRFQLESEKALFAEEVPWYQALVALGRGNREAALNKLEEVINNQGYHQTDALALKAKLQSQWYLWFNR